MKPDIQETKNLGDNATILIPVSERTTEQLLDNSFINIDKPAGPTSHDVAAKVKKMLNCNKTGHTGTLDPAVTGCLLIALNKAVRLTEYFLKGGKEYEGIMYVHQDVSEADIKAKMKEFTGKITQLPPQKSAVKREEREREIYEFETLKIEKRNVYFRVSCEAGTYIRKLCHDMGEALGTGAHMKKLRRTRVAEVTQDSLVTLEALESAYKKYKEGHDKDLRKMLIAPENALTHLPSITISDSFIPKIKNGLKPKNKDIIQFPKNPSPIIPIKIQSENGTLIGIASFREPIENLKEKEKISFKPDKILIS